ncbi:hypothetical protein ILYODFUR_038591 [Ilyodon furcidens]|uniref:Uncharacterized protein n=1 Tax=Ilyodon furcidens TaxID=33524 RepID=A0ABV0VLB6_9TELE
MLVPVFSRFSDGPMPPSFVGSRPTGVPIGVSRVAGTLGEHFAPQSFPRHPCTPPSANCITLPLMEDLGVRVRHWSAARIFHLYGPMTACAPILLYNLNTLTYNMFMTFTCRALGVGTVNGIKSDCILVT